MRDLSTAVIAATHKLMVVHYDSDFETAPTLFAFEHQWVICAFSIRHDERYRN